MIAGFVDRLDNATQGVQLMPLTHHAAKTWLVDLKRGEDRADGFGQAVLVNDPGAGFEVGCICGIEAVQLLPGAEGSTKAGLVALGGGQEGVGGREQICVHARGHGMMAAQRAGNRAQHNLARKTDRVMSRARPRKPKKER